MLLGSSNKERRQKLLGKYGIDRALNHRHITGYKISLRNYDNKVELEYYGS